MEEKLLKEFDNEFDCRISSEKAQKVFNLKFGDNYKDIFSKLDKLLISKDDIYCIDDDVEGDDEFENDNIKLNKSNFYNFIEKVNNNFNHSECNFVVMLVYTRTNSIALYYNSSDFGIENFENLLGIDEKYIVRFANRFDINDLFLPYEEEDEDELYNDYRVIINLENQNTIDRVVKFYANEFFICPNDDYMIFIKKTHR